MLASIERRFSGERPEVPIQLLWALCTRQKIRENSPKSLVYNHVAHRFAAPQSNGMAEAFVKTLKRDYVAVYDAPDALTVLRRLQTWFQHYNDVHPHKVLGYQSPRAFRR